MGGLYSSLMSYFSGVKGRVLMLGLDAGGKTTILNFMKIGQEVATQPTIGFNVEDMEIGSTHMILWDIGGQERLRSLWHHYFSECQGIVWVVDSADRDRFAVSAKELEKVLMEADKDMRCPVCVIANKQDLSGAASASELDQLFKLKTIAHPRPYQVFPTAKNDQNSYAPPFHWLADQMKRLQR